MIWIILMLLVGILLSAFFSGTETGFYRVSRVRLVLDGLVGDPIARGLLWLTNNPTLFVATTLVGNNLANYVTSLAIVLATDQIVRQDTFGAQLIAPVVFAPVVFVYGELLPKSLFYQAPNRLLRRGGPLFMLCGVLFAPLTAILWAFGRFLGWIVGQSPEHVRLMLARRELSRVLEEGHEAGILRPAQRNLAQGLFAAASQPVVRFATPVARTVSVRIGLKRSDVLRLARRHHLPAIPVEEAGHSRRLVGYVRMVDLSLQEGDRIEQVRPLMQIPHTETYIVALMRMQSQREMLARVVDEAGRTVGILNARRLTEPLFRGEV